MLLSRVPYPLEKGDKLRAFHHLKEINERHKGLLVCLNDGKQNPDVTKTLSQNCTQLHIIKLSHTLIFVYLVQGIYNATPYRISFFYHTTAPEQNTEIL